MDREADRIRGLILDTCDGAQPASALVEVRAELLALAAQTRDGEAADDACQHAQDLDARLHRLDAPAPARHAS